MLGVCVLAGLAATMPCSSSWTLDFWLPLSVELIHLRKQFCKPEVTRRPLVVNILALI